MPVGYPLRASTRTARLRRLKPTIPCYSSNRYVVASAMEYP